MALDIFSSFDDHYKVFMNLSYFMWVSMFMGAYICMSYKVHMNKYLSSLNLSVMKVVKTLYKQSNLSKVGGSASVITTLMYMLILMNLQGLLPYTFSLTSHLAINLGIAFPLWLTVILMSTSYDLGGFLSHLQPLGAPALLSPFLCVIELVSLMVRPLTLTVRLTANLSTGHIMVGLLGVSFSNSFSFISVFILMVGSFYLIFEIAVCMVQSYIFTLLPTLYGDEHPL